MASKSPPVFSPQISSISANNNDENLTYVTLEMLPI